MNFNTLLLGRHLDSRGALNVFDFSDLPFKPKRMFYISYAPKNTIRGQHGHYKCKQFYICIQGMIDVIIYSNKKETIVPLSPGEAIFIDKMTWTSEKFLTGKDVLLVLCSHAYDKQDYFTDKNISK